MNRSIPTWVSLTAILTLALVLRLALIGKESLWFDEIFSITLAARDLGAALAAERTNPPLHFVLLHLWMKLFGTSAESARALSVIPSLLAVWGTFALGRMLYGERAGLIAALGMAISSFQVYYAQEARTFALLLCLLTYSCLSFAVITLKESPRLRGWLLLYFVTTLLALYSHFYAVFFVAAQNIYFVGRWKAHRRITKLWVVVQVALGLLFLPWLLQMIAAAGAGGQVRRHLWLKLPQTFFSFLAGDSLIPLDENAVLNIRETLRANMIWLVLSVVGFGLILLEAVRTARRHPSAAAFCAVMILGPVLMSFVVSLRIPMFEERYLIGVTPLLYVFLAAGLAQPHAEGRTALRRSAVAMVSLVIVVSLAQYYFHPRFGRDEWREVGKLLNTAAEHGELVLVEPDYVDICIRYYSEGELNLLPITDDIPADPDKLAALIERLRGHGTFWHVRSNYRDRALISRIESVFESTESWTFTKDKGIEVQRFKVH